jgi:hypothetical protein
MDGAILLAAFYLYVKATLDYKNIALVVFLWLLVSDVTYNYFFLEFRAQNNWVIYQLYNLINTAVILFLAKNKSHLVILGLIVANVLLNIVVSYYFIANSVSHMVYNLYPYVATAIAISALAYLWMLGNGVRFLDSDDNNRGYIANLLRVRYGVYNRGSK